MNTLHVLLPPLKRAARVPGFTRWLAQGNRLPMVPGPRRSILHELFHLPGGELPAGALRHLGHAGEVPRGTWVAADPAWVRSEATGARLMVWPLPDLTPPEADELVAGLGPLLGEMGADLHMDAPGEWSIGPLAEPLLVHFVDPCEALGADLLACLPQGDEGRAWRRLFNEVQMFLHAHPVNQARAAAGLHPANALWLWGAGPLPGKIEATVAAVASTDTVLQGLARIAGIPCVAPDPSAFNPLRTAGSMLLDLDAPTVIDLDAWFPHLRRALRGRRFDSLDLLFADTTRVAVRRVHQLRFWRRG